MLRRNFLLGSLCGFYVVSQVDPIWDVALADSPLNPSAEADTAQRVLVVINFQGGNDGLNTLVPFAAPEYYRYRPTIAIPQNDVLRLNADVGLHPSLTALKKLYDQGQVALVQGVGYPGPDHSHFRSTEIWQTAAPDRFERTGWIGRYLDESALPSNNLFNAVAMSDVLPEMLVANHTDVPAISALRNYGLTSDKQIDQRTAFTSLAKDAWLPFQSPYLAHIAEIEEHAQRGAQELPKLLQGYHTEATYPATNLGRSLALAAQIVGSNIGTRVIYVQHGSFDTHVSQRATQDRLLKEFSEAIAAFYRDLKEHGNDNRVLTMTFSEFGRRVAENASRGTDHGEAAPLFIVGPVRGGLYGAAPSLQRLDAGDVTYTTDFRAVYATVLEDWLGRPSNRVLGGTYQKIAGLL